MVVFNKGESRSVKTDVYNIFSKYVTADSSYYFLIASFLALFLLAIFLAIFNPNGWDKVLGYEVLLTFPIMALISFLIVELYKVRNNKDDETFTKSFYKYLFCGERITGFCPPSSKILTVILFILIFVIGIGSFFGILGIGGAMYEKPPENNTALFFNFLIIYTFLIIVCSLYNYFSTKDAKILEKTSKAFQELIKLRTRATLYFMLFIFGLIAIYFLNPWGIMTNYGGISLFFLVFIGCVLFGLIYFYQQKINGVKDIEGYPLLALLGKGIYILVALLISGLLIYGFLSVTGIFNQDASKPENALHIMFNLFLLCCLFALIYKLANAGGFLDKNPYYRLIINTLFYIPCLLIILLNRILKILGYEEGKSQPPTKKEIIILIVSIVLLVSYFVTTSYIAPRLKQTYLIQGGNQLINQPVSLSSLNNIASYEKLNGLDTHENGKHSYQYAISFWFYLDSFPPSTSSAYSKVVPILSYAENPTVKYNSSDNTIYITVKQKVNDDDINFVNYIQEKEVEINPETVSKWKSIQEKISNVIDKIQSVPLGQEVDADGHRMIYKQPNVQLQKWNHIVLNYNGGTLDVFYNGKLVKSAIEVVPYLSYDMLSVGSENGISGNIANLIYFQAPLDYLTVNTLYMSLKNQNPPVDPNNTESIIQT